jgi:hypothetical protein
MERTTASPDAPILLAHRVAFETTQFGNGRRRQEQHHMMFTFGDPEDAYQVLRAFGWNVRRNDAQVRSGH